MEVKFENLKYNSNAIISGCIENGIIGVIGKNAVGKSTFLRTLNGKQNLNNASIFINKKLAYLDKLNMTTVYLSNNIDDEISSIRVMDEIKLRLSVIKKQELLDMIKIFGLKEEILKNNFMDLELLDKKKILLISTLLSTKKIIIIDDITEYLDYKSLLNLVKILTNIKRKNKIILISTNNLDFILKTAYKVILLQTNNAIIGEKYEILSNKVLLTQNNLIEPGIIEFKNAAYEHKQIKLEQRDNINDLIKDIYRHAK